MIARKTVLDQRGGQPPTWVLLPKGVERLMQVPDRMRKSVGFVYFRRKGIIEPAATALIAGLPISDQTNSVIPFLMTAHHVIAGIGRESDDGAVLLRLNTREGGATHFESSVHDWIHLDPNVDCSVLPWSPRSEMSIDCTIWNLHGSSTNAEMAKDGIGLGDEVFMVGLFRNHLGRDRNEPIVRVGNIAAIPADPIRVEAYGNMRAILIEARSIGGLSGSPVFVHMGFTRFRNGRVMHFSADHEQGAGPFPFLGLMHGHWDALDAEVDSSLHESEKINMGIGIVVPADEIIPRLEETFKEALMEAKNKIEGGSPTQDVSIESESEFDRFETLTKQLVNTPKPKPDESES